MAHELTIHDNGAVEMAYTGELPWHGLGNVLQPGASIEEWVESAGMAWRIMRSRVRYATCKDATADSYKAFDDRLVLFRDDTKAPLGVVSDGFQVVQPKEVLEFFRDLVESAGMELETAGTLFGGKRFWAMAKLRDSGIVVADKRDTIKQNLLLATACDGSMATEGAWIAIRVVCNNTLQIGRGERDVVKVKINHKSKFDGRAVKAELGIEKAQSVFQKTVAAMREMTRIRVTPEQAITATARLFNPDFDSLDDKGRDKAMRSSPVAAIGKLALDGAAIGSDMQGTQGTAYGWLNAVTEYVDHAGRSRTQDARLNSAWFGKGSDLKAQAFAMAPTLGEIIAETNAMLESTRKPTTGSAFLDSVIEETVL